ncbi:MAG: hypothetical protein QM775_11360 [Pirellulales bacterium]
MERVIFQTRQTVLGERIWPSAPRPRDMISLKNIEGNAQALFLVERVTWEEQDDGGRIPVVSVLRLDRTGTTVIDGLSPRTTLESLVGVARSAGS